MSGSKGKLRLAVEDLMSDGVERTTAEIAEKVGHLVNAGRAVRKIRHRRELSRKRDGIVAPQGEDAVHDLRMGIESEVYAVLHAGSRWGSPSFMKTGPNRWRAVSPPHQ